MIKFEYFPTLSFLTREFQLMRETEEATKLVGK